MNVFRCTLTDTDHLAVARHGGAVLLTVREMGSPEAPRSADLPDAAELELTPADAREVAATLDALLSDENDTAVHIAAGVRLSQLADDEGYLVTIDGAGVEYSVGLDVESAGRLVETLEALAAEPVDVVELEPAGDHGTAAMVERALALRLVFDIAGKPVLDADDLLTVAEYVRSGEVSLPVEIVVDDDQVLDEGRVA